MEETSSMEDQPPQHQVFISFRGADLRLKFVSHLVKDLKRYNINVFIDEYEKRGQPIDILFKRIEESKIVLVIFSNNFTNSLWCVRELEKIKDCTDQGTLVAIPIFYKLEPSTVRDLKGSFGDSFRSLAKDDERKKKWKEAFNLIPNIMGIIIDKKSVESEKVNEIVKAVKTALTEVSWEGSQNVSVVDPSGNSNGGASAGGEKHKTFGNGQRLKELEEKLDMNKYKGTRIIGVVGMPGIGKTTLLKELYKTWQRKFSRHALIDQIRVKLKHLELDCLPQMLLGELSKLNDPHIHNLKDPYSQLRERKVFVVLDDVSKREHIDALRGILDFIKEGQEGSRVVIATSDMSLTNGLVDDTYMVQSLNHRDSLQLFHYHAFNDDQANPRRKDFMKLSDEFVHYARGHPLALKILGRELNKKDMDHWNSKRKKLAQSPSPNIVSVFQVSYDELTSEQKDAFLDLACFRSQDKDYVESLLASSDPGSAEAMSEVKALTNKFLINTCDGRVEMHDLLYTFSRERDLKAASTQDGSGQRRLWLHQDIIKGGVINVLQNKMRAANIRGIFLDLYDVKDETSLDRDHFINMGNLRYVKFYNSHCPQECKTSNKINIPDKLKLPLKEVRCLHWLKFPLEELPNDFNPINLVDLKLPYSKIKQLWEGDKDTPFLKWVDLNHSSKLCSLSGLSKAEKLQRLNLEGCTILKTLPHDMDKMKMLAFLNLKGCTSLESLPEMNLISLKTLTLSGCSTFKEFPLISENLETLYIDGTAISQFPANMEKLLRLVVLNMKDCKMLEKIPDRIGELKALQELILSDCSDLKEFPEINMSSLNILLLDGTAIEVMPQLPSVQYLCLSRNEKISCLPIGISHLFQLKWLDLKYCTSLTSVPEFPPNLQCLDAHGCTSLKTVSKPLARIKLTEQNHSTLIFTNCDNLEQASKEEITSYAQRKCQLLSYARKRYNGGLVSESLFSTCFPGCEVPSWFCHETVGSELEVELFPHWHDKKLAGIALCAVVSCLDPQYQISRLSVTCTFKVKDEDKSCAPFCCPVGSWTRHGGEKDKIELDHVFIGYTSCPHTITCPKDGNSDECSPTEASLKFTVTGGPSGNEKFKVLKCGLSLVYAKDKNKNSSHGAKYDMPVLKRFQENSEGVDGRVEKTKAKYDMPVEKSSRETSEGVNGRVKRKKNTRRDNGRRKKKQRLGRDNNQNCDESVTPRRKDNVSCQAHG